jgi:glycosyltransferase involved in cell wall biosynthesis
MTLTTRDPAVGPVRVTYLLDSPNLGGAETTILQLAAAADVDATVVAAEPVSDRFVRRAEAHARVVRVAPVGRRWHAVPRVVRAIAATAPDVVHATLVDPASNAVVMAAAARHPAPALATCHMTGDLGSAGARRNLAATYGRLDHVVAVSSQIAALLGDRLGVPPDRLSVVGNGVALERPPAAPPERSEPVVGTVARLTAQKGVDLLLDALRELGRRGHRPRLVVAGDGRDRAALEAAAAGLPVEFRGHVDDVPALLAELDVFCLASRAEGLPLALLEAMAAGLPCVATDVGDVRSAVGDGAVVVPPEDTMALAAALEQLVVDPGRRRRLGRRARERAEQRFDVRHTVATVTDLYRRLVAGAGARSAGGQEA